MLRIFRGAGLSLRFARETGMSAKPLADEIREVMRSYPDTRSAIMPALRIAQERHGGWLPPKAFEEVGDALGLTPAYCQSVASFYDMFHLAPVGRHLVEVCTNVSCALVGAQQVLEEFERELDVRPGETTEDGEVTLRTVECAGGCGWGTVVSVDHRYREPVRPGDVPAIVEELRAE
jgi:NADH-quinone oxidoreductase subunit E